MERSLDQRAEDMEVHWMTKKSMTKKQIWSEKYAFDLLRSSYLRSRRRRERGQGKVKSVPEQFKLKYETPLRLPYFGEAKVTEWGDVTKVSLIILVGVMAMWIMGLYTDTLVEQKQVADKVKT